MVGSVGAVNMPPIGRAKEPVEDAFDILRGWDKKIGKPIENWLEQILEAIVDNKTAYDLATSRANANSVKERDLRKLKLQVDTDRKIAVSEALTAKTAIADGLKVLETQRAAFNAQTKASDLAVSERERLVTAREKVAEIGHAKLQVIDRAQEQRQAKLATAEAAAAGDRLHIDKIASQLRTTLSQLGEK